LVRLEPLSPDDISALISSAIDDPRGLASAVTIEKDAVQRIVDVSGGDARRALTILEAAAQRAAELQDSKHVSVSVDDVVSSLETAMVRYDREGEQHYDTISAFIKSVRGSDADAAIHYLARMLEGGEDPRFIARRLILLASEDIGLADPTALGLAVACYESVSIIGMPEGRIPLSEATIYLSLSPKSNSAYLAIDSALADVRGGFLPAIPLSLRGTSLGRGEGDKQYRYPHDDERMVVAQSYVDNVPEYFHPKSSGFEKPLVDRWKAIKDIIRGKRA
jgi:putative ATPase